MRRIRAAVVVALALVAALTTAVSADADSRLHRDAVGDLQAADDDEQWYPFPDRVEGDIVWTRVSHLPRTVRVRIKFAKLDRVDGGGGVSAQFRTGRTGPTKHYILAANASYGDWRGYSDFWFYDDCDCMAVAPKPADSGCKGASHQFDYADDSVLLIVPRRCLGSPRFVRVAIESSRAWTWEPSSIDGSAAGVFDDGHRTGASPLGFVEPIYGRRVYVG